MKKVRYRYYLDYEKEEKWINEMAEQGWHLKKWFLGRFTFAKGDPGSFIYRNEFIIEKSKKEKKEYFELLEDSGLTIIHESGGWIYMKKAAAEGPFELYTDTHSKIDYYKRMLNIFLVLFFVNVFAGIVNTGILGDQSLPKLMNSVIGFLNIAVAIILTFPIIKIIQRKRALKRSKDLFE